MYMEKGNNMAKKDIWIDLTDMLAWNGHFTGIQRVTYAYAERYEKEGAHFFAFDRVDGRFFEISLNTFRKKDIKSEPLVSALSRRARVRQIVGAPYYTLSDRNKERLRPLVGVANHSVRYVLNKVAPVDVTEDSIYSHFPDASFRKGDTVVLIGAGWNEGAVLQELSNIKQQSGIRIVQHVNDILPIYQPQLFADNLPKIFTPYIELAMRNADVITVISEATKRDVLVFCKEKKITSPRISVVRLGDDVKSVEGIKPKSLGEDDKFILSVGTFEIRKNYILLYQAVKLGQLEERELPKIVIAGRKGWLTDDITHVLSMDPFTKDRIIWLDDVKDEELAWLYSNCMFTVFPSLAEGWGLPVVESLQNGKMCLASGVSSMLEIGDGMVDYFLPYDSREVLEKITYYVTDGRYKVMNDKIKKSYKIHTWDESYQQFRSSVSK